MQNFESGRCSPPPFPKPSHHNCRSPRDISQIVQLFDARTAKILVTICVFLAVAAFLYGIRQTIVIFLFAIFFAYLLEPLVARIENSPIGLHSRGLAITEAYLCLAGLLAAFAIFFGPRLVADTKSLVQSLPELLQKVASGNIVWQLGRKHGWSADTQIRIEQLISSHQTEIESWLAGIGADVAQALANALWVALVPILAVFFLADGRRFAQVLVDAVDRREEKRLLRGIIADLDQMLARFIFAQITLGAFSLIAYSAVLELLNFPYALVLGLVGGLLEFIPVVGPLIAAATILGVGFLTGFSPLWAVLIFLGIWRVCQDYVVSPRIYGRGLKMHPLAAIAAVLMGGELGGILGVYLAIPIMAGIRVVWSRWQDFSAVESPPPATLAQIPPMPPRKTAIR